MKFGVNTFIWAASFDHSIARLLPVIKQGGFDGLEVPLFRAVEFPACEIRRSVEENGLECTVCSVLPPGLSVIATDAATRRATRAHLEDAVKAAAEAGAKLVAGPLYSPVGHLPGRRRTAAEWAWAVECYQSLGPVLQRYGVQIAIEPLNRFETYFLNTAADAAALCAEIGHPNVGILFDTFHANIEEKSVGTACRTAGPHLKHFHASENDRGIPGSGHTDWQGVFRSLYELEYNGWLTIESFGFALGELSAAASIWRDLAPTPDAIAFEGLRFLKENVDVGRLTATRP